MQQALSEKIGGIESKVRQLASKLETLQAANNALLNENKKLKKDLIHKNTEILGLEKRSKILPLAEKNSEKEDKRSKQLKKEIAQYIKEIDKCIDWLKNS